MTRPTRIPTQTQRTDHDTPDLTTTAEGSASDEADEADLTQPTTDWP